MSLRSPRSWGLQPWLVVLGAAVLGAACGVLWEWLWEPPMGTVMNGTLHLDGSGLRSAFAGTGSYVLIAAVAGLLLGVVVAMLPSRDEVVTLVALVVGSVLAGWLMMVVGHALGPPDPAPRAAQLADLERLPADLEAPGSAWVAFPGGALAGSLVVWWTVPRGSGSRGADSVR